MEKYLALVEVEAEPITAEEYYAEWQGMDKYNFDFPGEDIYAKGYILYPTTELMKLDTCDCHFWKSDSDFKNNCVPVDGTMPFEFALAMAKRGHKIKRKLWEKQDVNAYVTTENGGPVMHLIEISHSILWIPLTGDVMAKDWILVKE